VICRILANGRADVGQGDSHASSIIRHNSLSTGGTDQKSDPSSNGGLAAIKEYRREPILTTSVVGGAAGCVRDVDGGPFRVSCSTARNSNPAT
jgi:hypothetical protein